MKDKEAKLEEIEASHTLFGEGFNSVEGGVQEFAQIYRFFFSSHNPNIQYI